MKKAKVRALACLSAKLVLLVTQKRERREGEGEGQEGGGRVGGRLLRTKRATV